MPATTIFYSVSRGTTADGWFEDVSEDGYSNPLHNTYETLEAAQKSLIHWKRPEDCCIQRITITAEDVWPTRSL